jgi:hypothetical protein
MDAIDQLKEDVRQGRIDVDRLIDVIVSLQRQLEASPAAHRGTREKAGRARSANAGQGRPIFLDAG